MEDLRHELLGDIDNWLDAQPQSGGAGAASATNARMLATMRRSSSSMGRGRLAAQRPVRSAFMMRGLRGGSFRLRRGLGAQGRVALSLACC